MRTIEEAKKFIEFDARNTFYKICRRRDCYPQFTYKKSYSWYGSTNQDLWRIQFSLPFILVNKDNDYVLQQLARHEVCHLFVHNHGPAFKRICASVGCELSGAKFTITHNCPEEKYTATCSCGTPHMRMKPVKERKICKVCGDELFFKLNPLYV